MTLDLFKGTVAFSREVDKAVGLVGDEGCPIVGKEYFLVKSAKPKRKRNFWSTWKSDGSDFEHLGHPERRVGDYGYKWAQTYKGKKTALPSLREVADGLFDFYWGEINSKFDKSLNENIKRAMKEQERTPFEFVTHKLGIADVDFALTSKLLGNPESNQVMILHFFLSMDPPFYAHLNKAVRSMDQAMLPKLGPFARALSIFMYHSDESNKNRQIKLMKGLDEGFEGPLGHFNKSFLLFKGSLLKNTCIETLTGKIGQMIKIPGFLVASKNLATAIGHSLCQHKTAEDRTPVLFMILVRNCYLFEGARLLSYNKAAYAQDDDFIFKECSEIVVLSVQKDQQITNNTTTSSL